jgi:uncharacterized membrane protein YphA (DoxX/SURF4 family)
MNNSTRLLLVLLRLAIGWHLLFAGLTKFGPDYRGSEGYLLESSGPLAGLFHNLVGDRVVSQLTVEQLPPNQDPATTPLSARLPAALAAEWDGYLERFSDHYRLTPQQQELAHVRLQQYKDRTATWILQGSKLVRKPSPAGPPLEVNQTTQERLRDYLAQRDALRKYQVGEFSWAMRTPFSSDKNRELMAQKAAVARLRSELIADLDLKTAEYKEALRELLTAEQVDKGPIPAPVRIGFKYMSRQDWIDFVVRWGLTITGGCLLLGLFSRTACVVAALLVLSFFAAMPPLPGLPEVVRAEGFPYVNKNLIEILALLTLATTHSGKWGGVDGLLYWLNPWRRMAIQGLPAAPSSHGSDRGALAFDKNRRADGASVPAPVSARKE